MSELQAQLQAQLRLLAAGLITSSLQCESHCFGVEVQWEERQRALVLLM